MPDTDRVEPTGALATPRNEAGTRAGGLERTARVPVVRPGAPLSDGPAHGRRSSCARRERSLPPGTLQKAALSASHSLLLRVVSKGRRLIEPVRRFLSSPRCAVLSTLGTDGAPRQIVIHYMLGDDHILLNGHRDRRWVANVRRDPRVALIVHDAGDYLHYVSIHGRVTLVDEGAEALAQAMRQAERYGEKPADFAGQPRVSFRVDPEHLHEYG